MPVADAVTMRVVRREQQPRDLDPTGREVAGDERLAPSGPVVRRAAVVAQAQVLEARRLSLLERRPDVAARSEVGRRTVLEEAAALQHGDTDMAIGKRGGDRQPGRATTD